MISPRSSWNLLRTGRWSTLILVLTGSITALAWTCDRQVRGAETAVPKKAISFRNEVEPVLTKLGCNQGACHGSQHGKGGFKLSLLGFEPEADYTSIVKSAEQRRVAPFAPEESLLLLKPTLAVAHGGGKKMEAGSPSYRLLVRWLEQGAPEPRADDPRIVGLKVYPDRVLMAPGQEQRLVVLATLSDGSKSDVTSEARFDTLNEGVATVRPSGLARTIGKGEANIMVRYQGLAAMARLTVPFNHERPFAFPSRNIVDVKAAKKWREMGLVPSSACSDSEFLPTRDARHDRHHTDSRTRLRTSSTMAIPASATSWSIVCSIARSTSITGR